MLQSAQDTIQEEWQSLYKDHAEPVPPSAGPCAPYVTYARGINRITAHCVNGRRHQRHGVNGFSGINSFVLDDGPLLERQLPNGHSESQTTRLQSHNKRRHQLQRR